MSTFYLKTNDRYPSIAATLKLSDGTAIDLTGATVVFHMTRGATPKVNAAAVVVSAAAGQVRYDWVAGDTDTPGTYACEWQATLASGKVVTVPNNGDDTVVIRTELA